MNDLPLWLFRANATLPDPRAMLRQAIEFEERGSLPLAASALDRAYGVDPNDSEITEARRRVLDAMSIEEHGLIWRYVPAGPFTMGWNEGEPDEARQSMWAHGAVRPGRAACRSSTAPADRSA